ncbi:sensor histidine kinase [Streptomyces sp. Li-HN-5-11]|uniref:sensor histidine kinase n=1 Tax=Streptomyces sp. Li-HN-5-11 TaxID=3075432 RepID=UPI0028ACEBCA|nr:sensor histidine kinase [Streptomyces sp. Li-HN-5-11]WNM31441.1 sensor histidine kinase [Streptomyces sp. Li-HN-5-11]
MYATLTLPLLKRVPPGALTALAWLVVTLYPTLLVGQHGAAAWFNSVTMSGRSGATSRDWSMVGAATLVALAGSALLARRPLAGLALLITGSVAVTEGWSFGSQFPPLQFLPADIALLVIAATRPRRTVRIAAGTLIGVLVAHIVMVPRTDTGDAQGAVLLAVIALLIGRSMRQARDHAEELSAQAAARAVTAERLRIARELHDMVAHTIGIVALQAGAARRVIETQPDRARTALGEIENASRETLSGLRRMLGALRQPEPGSDAEPAPMDPGPGLASVDRLAETTAAAGVKVDVRWSGERRHLPAEIDMSAFRIIQEAVTNVVRHAGTKACQVSIDCQESELSIEVLDQGRRHPQGGAAGSGFGLVGMRERVDLLHGEFSAEPLPEGGFRVAARLPVPEGVR